MSYGVFFKNLEIWDRKIAFEKQKLKKSSLSSEAELLLDSTRPDRIYLEECTLVGSTVKSARVRKESLLVGPILH